MAGIFVSYRRAGASNTTYRLVDDLRRAFGPDSVFLDVESIEPGIPFADAIRQSLARSSVALVIIGPTWLEAKDKDGNRRLDKPDDWVRQEVKAALESNARVIPVIVEGARNPSSDDLPADIAQLGQLHSFTLLPSQTHWSFDISRLVEKISSIDRNLAKKRQSEPPQPIQQSSHFSYKVIAGFVLYVLISATAMVEGWYDSDEYLGAIFFLLITAILFIWGFIDTKTGKVTGKKSALLGIGLATLSLIGHSIGYSVIASQELNWGTEIEAQPLTSSVGTHTPAVEEVGVQTLVFGGNWTSPTSNLVITQSGRSVSFTDFNAFGVQVGSGSGSANGNSMEFSYYNSMFGLNTNGTASVNGDAMNVSLVDPSTGQPFYLTYYRQ